MNDVMNTISYYFSFPFVRYAVMVGTLISLCASLLGVILVLKRYSFIGDGLSHVAFGAVAIATVFGLSDNTPVVMIITIICAVFLLKSGGNGKVNGDASIAMLSVGALSVGYMLLNVFSKSANISGDVCSTLFGSASILTLKEADVWLSVVLSIVVLILFIVLYNKLFTVTFDENYARATGIKTNFYNLVIAVVIAVIIVMGMKLVGSLLISALIVYPALTAMRVFHTFKGVIITAASIAVVSALVGMLCSILLSTPVGATIVVADIAFFVVFSIVSVFVKK